MIIRKPYAFLIKHFKRIHIFLFLLCTYVIYKTTQLFSFMKEFIELGTYDYINEPISGCVTFLAYIFIILIVSSMVAILILLRKKKKPWKMYILPIITYVGLFITFIITSSFFATYIGGTDTTGPRAIRDILLILLVPQYITFLILIIRILGIDLNKFDFKSDEEYLELSSADQEEMEININIDKGSIKRFIKRFKRNSGYYIQEHKKIITVLLVIALLFSGWKTYEYIFITNKTYSQGDIIKTNGYEITINNSYYSNIDYKGDVIFKESSFVILDVTITNTSQKRKINFARFHVMNGTDNYTPTAKTYETQFSDLGTAYEEKTINNGERFNTLLIFKVDSTNNMKRFVLYYQEFNNDNTNHLRKIKLKLEDLTTVEEKQTLSLDETLNFNIGKQEKELLFDSYEIVDSVSYNKQDCSSITCGYNSLTTTAKTGKKILKIDFASNDFDGKDMIDFLSKYGKISYIDNNDKEYTTKIENALPTYQYYGKYAYITVPQEIIDAKSISLVITVRNNKYIYKFK